MPFCGTLDPDNCWVLLAELIPWQELEEAYAPQFSATVGAPAKPVRLAFGSLYIKQRVPVQGVDIASSGTEDTARSV